VTFEFDPAKSAANKAKHGMAFDEAQAMWAGKTISVQLAFAKEPRWLVIGKIAGKHWAAVVTARGSALRLISVRRARKKEEQIYEQAQ
jgi:uncharacterized DUF497 family protein